MLFIHVIPDLFKLSPKTICDNYLHIKIIVLKGNVRCSANSLAEQAIKVRKYSNRYDIRFRNGLFAASALSSGTKIVLNHL